MASTGMSHCTNTQLEWELCTYPTFPCILQGYAVTTPSNMPGHMALQCSNNSGLPNTPPASKPTVLGNDPGWQPASQDAHVHTSYHFAITGMPSTGHSAGKGGYYAATFKTNSGSLCLQGLSCLESCCRPTHILAATLPSEGLTSIARRIGKPGPHYHA